MTLVRFLPVMMFNLSLVLAAVALANASPQPLSRRWGEMKVKHEWMEGAPVKWHSVGAPPTDATIDLRLKLKSAVSASLCLYLYRESDNSEDGDDNDVARNDAASVIDWADLAQTRLWPPGS